MSKELNYVYTNAIYNCFFCLFNGKDLNHRISDGKFKKPVNQF